MSQVAVNVAAVCAVGITPSVPSPPSDSLRSQADRVAIAPTLVPPANSAAVQPAVNGSFDPERAAESHLRTVGASAEGKTAPAVWHDLRRSGLWL